MAIFNRKSNRLPHKPIYEGNYCYFITICTQNRKNLLCNVESATTPTLAKTESSSLSKTEISNLNQKKLQTLTPNKIGEIIENTWLDIPNHYKNVVIDQFVVMPNHIHGIIQFHGTPISISSKKKTSL